MQLRHAVEQPVRAPVRAHPQLRAGPEQGGEAGEALVEDDDGVGDRVGGGGGFGGRGREEEGGGVGHRRERHGGDGGLVAAGWGRGGVAGTAGSVGS